MSELGQGGTKGSEGNEVFIVYDELKSSSHIQAIIDGLPYPCFILNSKRQVVFASKFFLENSGNEIMGSVLGKRVGEILGCIHAKENEGCGTSEACKYCGASNSILFCKKNDTSITEEYRIHALKDNQNISYDYRITASPFYFNDKQYVIFSIADISHEKRRKIMEKLFFHDINNKVGSLNGLIEVLKKIKLTPKDSEYLHMLEIIGHSLSQEILAHKQLLSAENGELQIQISKFSLKEFIIRTCEIIKQNNAAFEKNVVVDNKLDDILVCSDEIVLQRILLNMLKNALESINYSDFVTVGCNILKDSFQIWVHNPGVMSPKVQKQVFQRSFSTKGNDRGLGTYGMKLLGENYLKGKVGFTSTEAEGTLFYIILPK